MGIQETCLSALERCESYFRIMEASVPPPQWVPWEDMHNWRYVEKLPSQALVQKLARIITGLKTFDLLLRVGHLQELGATMRSLDEIGQDIAYISLGILTDDWTEKHDAYLDYFWSEGLGGMECPVRRKSIRAYVNRAGGLQDTSAADDAFRAVYKVYSDYVHARSSPIMAMVVGPPARFDLGGIYNAEARRPFVEQAPSYFYRSLASAYLAARVILSPDDASVIYNDIKGFEAGNAEVLFP